MNSLTNQESLYPSEGLTNSDDQQLEERLAQAAETLSALKPALGSSPSDGNTKP